MLLLSCQTKSPCCTHRKTHIKSYEVKINTEIVASNKMFYIWHCYLHAYVKHFTSPQESGPSTQCNVVKRVTDNEYIL